MGQIYSRANKVIAWFGVGPPELVDAVRGLRAAHLHMWPCNGQDLHIVRKLIPTFYGAEYRIGPGLGSSKSSYWGKKLKSDVGQRACPASICAFVSIDWTLIQTHPVNGYAI